jgi:hypothetical protein
MTHWRRRPREVYRVYCREAFLNRLDAGEPCDPVCPEPERRPRGLAGAVIFTGAVGGVASIVLTTSAPSGVLTLLDGPRGPQARPLIAAQPAAGRLRHATSARSIWQAPGALAFRPAGADRIPARARPSFVAVTVRGSGRTRRGAPPGEVRSVQRGNVSGHAAAGAQAVPAVVVSTVAGAPAGSRQNVEFGFER